LVTSFFSRIFEADAKEFDLMSSDAKLVITKNNKSEECCRGKMFTILYLKNV
jgi:hypothetical protein